MKILSLDTATECATCAIMEDDKLLGETIINFKKQHSVILSPMISDLLDNIQMNIQDLDGFVVSKGPGSFTGLRIGWSAVKAFCQGTNKPFVSVSSLDALAYNLAYANGIICPIMDALRGNVYTCMYKFENDRLTPLMEHSILSLTELIDILKNYTENIYFIGDAIEKNKVLLKNELTNVTFAPTHLNLVRASALGELGLKLLAQGIHDDLYSSAPVYLRKPQAEREYEEKLRKTKNE